MSITFIPETGLRLRTAVLRDEVEPSSDSPLWHLVRGDTPLVFFVDGSRLFRIDEEMFARLEEGDAAGLTDIRRSLAPVAPPSLPPVALRSLSLNLAQACNLSCRYCYADEGRFGGAARLMMPAIALRAIDALLAAADGKHRLTIGFIGGEPFLNRTVLHAAVAHAQRASRQLGIPVGFSVTTNGTLLNQQDLELLRSAAFAVTISLDGVGPLNDRHRRARTGSASATALARLRPLLDDPGRARVVARVTVARDDLRVLERVQALAEAGFREIGVSPLRASADPELALVGDDWAKYLQEMIRAAKQEWERVRGGAAWRFSNLAIALRELHHGSCRPLPCGAGAGYVSLSAEGRYFTCHRAIDDDPFGLGDLERGLDEGARRTFIARRHVDQQEPCRSCWARYLCGGGCHVEVIAAGRTGCDYIRGWLDYCLALYDRALTERPDLFDEPGGVCE